MEFGELVDLNVDILGLPITLELELELECLWWLLLLLLLLLFGLDTFECLVRLWLLPPLCDDEC